MNDRQVFAQIPANDALSLRLHVAGPPMSRVVLSEPARFAQETGVVHGGVLTALADTAAVYAIGQPATDVSHIAGISLNMSFLRPGVPGGAALVASARAIHAGRRLAVCEADVRQEARLLARGTFTFLIDGGRSRQSGVADGDRA